MRKLIKYLTSREMITYIIAGILTTLVNFTISYLMYNLLGINENITNAAAWAGAVIFAFFINDRWVFIRGQGNSLKSGNKFIRFVAGRLFTLVVELAATYCFVTVLKCGFWWIKVIIAVIVTVLNFVISKLLVFKTNN